VLFSFMIGDARKRKIKIKKKDPDTERNLQFIKVVFGKVVAFVVVVGKSSF